MGKSITYNLHYVKYIFHFGWFRLHQKGKDAGSIQGKQGWRGPHEGGQTSRVSRLTPPPKRTQIYPTAPRTGDRRRPVLFTGQAGPSVTLRIQLGGCPVERGKL
jgi:hypothetical protein